MYIEYKQQIVLVDLLSVLLLRI